MSFDYDHTKDGKDLFKAPSSIKVLKSAIGSHTHTYLRIYQFERIKLKMCLTYSEKVSINRWRFEIDQFYNYNLLKIYNKKI